MKDKIIKTALEIIEKEKSAKSVGLREIARRIDCSAPNIYNHFNNLNGLLNEVMQYIIEDFMRAIMKAMKKIDRQDLIILKSADTLVSYALKHEGWFYFFHFEKIDMKMTEDTKKKRRNTGEYMAKLIQNDLANRFDYAEVLRISGIIHNYILGELSQFLFERKPVQNRELFKKKIIKNSKELYDLFLNKDIQ